MTPPSNSSDVVALFGEVLADVFPDQTVLGGAPFNVARHLRAFDLWPVLISRTGNDALRAALLQEMAERGMDVSGIQCDPDHPTGEVRVILEDGDHRFDILPDQAYDHICQEATRQNLATRRPRLAYFGTLALRNAVSRLAAQRFLQDCQCPVFLDINLRAPWYDEATITRALESADIVKLNEDELAVIAGMFGFAGMGAEAQARALQQRFGLRQLLVTCGTMGSWLLDERQVALRTAPVTTGQPVIDTVGAGDAFAAVYMMGLLNQWDAQTSLQCASDYAATICQVRGAAPPTADFGQTFMQNWREEK